MTLKKSAFPLIVAEKQFVQHFINRADKTLLVIIWNRGEENRGKVLDHRAPYLI
ncbi:MAG: hypothetical protein PHY16_11820 [Methylobacter sp.]|nr:hypothetical protein [Methylobacter sp.]